MFKIQNEYLNVMKPYQTSFYKKTQKHEKKKGTRNKGQTTQKRRTTKGKGTIKY
jgi:hypothetical protein